MTSRIIRGLRRLATLLPLLLTLQISSVPDLVAQVIGTGETDCCGTECQDAPDGQKCPPRCATCACPLGQPATTTEVRRQPPRAPSSILQAAAQSRTVPEPDRERIFHPPRA